MGPGMYHLKLFQISISQNCRFLHLKKKESEWGNYSMFPFQSPVKAAVVVSTNAIPVKVALARTLSQLHDLFLARCHNWACVLKHLVVEASIQKPGRRGWPRRGS